jgi:hypothetical protein
MRPGAHRGTVNFYSRAFSGRGSVCGAIERGQPPMRLTTCRRAGAIGVSILKPKPRCDERSRMR